MAVLAAPTTFSVTVEGSSKSLHLDVNRDDDQVVVASSATFRIYHIEDDRFRERVNLRGSKAQNLNSSCNDVCWNKHDPHILATAASNGAVVLWNLAISSRTKQEHVFKEHQRSVNKVTFHPIEANYLLSGSQDGTMKLFDTRTHEVAQEFVTKSNYSVRDVAFCPHGNGHLFAAGMENGQIQLWDVRRPEKLQKKWPAHSDHIFAVDWHPESRYTLASAGRDKQIKVWNTSDTSKCEHLVYSIGPVGRIKWRPRYNYHLASCSGMVGDFSVSVWDVRRPYIPFAIFSEHKDVATDIKWLTDPDRLLSGGKDSLIHHAFSDGHRPASKAPPAGLAMSNRGNITSAFRDGSVSVTSPLSTLAAYPEIVPKFISSSLTPTESSTSFRMANFLRSRKDTGTSSSGNSDLSSPSTLTSIFGFDDNIEERPPPPPPAEKDLFLTCSSQLKEFSTLNGPGSWASLDYFVICAQKYMLSGASVDVLCEHNALVSDAAKRSQVAEAWRLIKLLVKDPLDMMDDDSDDDDIINFPASNLINARKGSENISENDSKHPAKEDDHGMVGSRNPNRSRAIENGVNESRSKRRGSSATSERSRYPRGKNSSAESGKADQNNVSDDETDEDYAENELTLTNIASGQMLTGGICNDFFGDAEIADLEIETFVSSDTSKEAPNWELKSEAFEPRINLNIELSDNENGQNGRIGDDFSGSGNENDSNGASGDGNGNNIDDIPNSGTNTGQTVIIEDQTSSLLIMESALERPAWGSTTVLRDTLIHFAEMGDVQTAVSMYMVLRSMPEYRYLIDETTLEYWFTCLLDLMQRFQLYNEATSLIKKCPLPCINQLNQQSTTFFSNCTKCNKALSRPQGSWWCGRCKRTPNLCSICREIVKGLFAWCQGCAHGGHLKCLRTWYTKNTLCPTGCGHHCEYQ